MLKKIIFLALTVMCTQTLTAGYNSGYYYGQDCCPQDCCDWGDICDAQFFVSVDWLYWKARRCDLNLFTIDGVETATTSFPDQTKITSFDHEYHSGVRARAGANWCSGWGVYVDYVYFSPCKTRNYHLTATDDVTTTRVPFEIGSIGAVEAKYKLELNQFDLLFSYMHKNNNCRQLSSFFGARFVWLDDKLRTEYQDVDGSPDAFFLLKEKNDVNAYGLVVGGEYFQSVFCSLGIYMRAAFSVLYADYDQKTKSLFQLNVTPIGSPFVVNLKNNQDCLLSILDLAAGIGFEGCEICCMKWTMAVGYEFHKWLNYSDYIRVQEGGSLLTNNKADLGFDGLFVRLGVEF